MAGRISPFNTYKEQKNAHVLSLHIPDNMHRDNGVISHLQSREKGKQGVHPGAGRQQGFVDVDVQ